MTCQEEKCKSLAISEMGIGGNGSKGMDTKPTEDDELFHFIYSIFSLCYNLSQFIQHKNSKHENLLFDPHQN